MNIKKIFLLNVFYCIYTITGTINPNKKSPHTIIGNKTSGDVTINFPSTGNLILNGNLKEIPTGKGIELRIDAKGKIKTQVCPMAYKENTVSITEDTTLIFTVDPKEFNYIGDTSLSWGIIAEDIINNDIFPDKLIMYDENDEPLAVYYDMVYIAMLIELKKLYLANIEKTSQITDLTSRVTTLENRSYGPYAEDAEMSSINQNNESSQNYDMSPIQNVDVSFNDFVLSDSQYDFEEYEEVPEIPSEGTINSIKSIHIIN